MPTWNALFPTTWHARNKSATFASPARLIGRYSGTHDTIARIPQEVQVAGWISWQVIQQWQLWNRRLGSIADDQELPLGQQRDVLGIRRNFIVSMRRKLGSSRRRNRARGSSSLTTGSDRHGDSINRNVDLMDAPFEFDGTLSRKVKEEQTVTCARALHGATAPRPHRLRRSGYRLPAAPKRDHMPASGRNSSLPGKRCTLHITCDTLHF